MIGENVISSNYELGQHYEKVYGAEMTKSGPVSAHELIGCHA
jgi:hypothetical protein